MNTQEVLTRINQLEKDLLELTKINDTQQIYKIVEIMEKYNKHQEILNYLKWQLGLLLGISVIGLIEIILIISIYIKL